MCGPAAEVPSPSLRARLATYSDEQLSEYSHVVTAVDRNDQDLRRCASYARALLRARHAQRTGTAVIVTPAQVVR